MDSAKLNDWMQVIGIFAVVASLIFVALQIRQDQAIAQAMIWSETEGSVNEMAQLFNQHPEIWIRGLKGEEMSEAEGLIFMSIAAAVNTRQLALFVRANRLNTAPPALIIEGYSYDLYRYPGLRRAYELRLEKERMRAGAFGTFDPTGIRFNRQIQEALAQLDATSPPVSERLFLTF